MRRINTLFLLASLSIASAFAQLGSGFVGNGYYRIRNLATSRYIYVTDNKDYYNKMKDAEDFQAIQLWKDANKAIPDPATVIYIEQQANNKNNYDLQAQGTGVHQFTGMYVNVKNIAQGVYEVYASRAGVMKYLSDDEQSTSEQGTMGTRGKSNYRRWVVDQITTNHATNFFGIKPDPAMQVNGKYYQPFFAAFPFKLASPNMRVYYISKVSGSEAVMKEILSGEVPASTPVIIECASTEPTNNRLELLTKSNITIKDNKLEGVYFCNGKRPQESTDAYKVFDESTMRVLSVVDGKLVMTNTDLSRVNKIKVTDWENLVKVQANCLFANTSYLPVAADIPATLSITIDATGIEDIISDNKDNAVEGVYTLSGAQLRTTNDVKGLPAGLYIVGGHKFVIK